MNKQYQRKVTPGVRIKEALALRGMKPAELAERSGLSKSSISCYISGKYEPKQEALYKMGVVLDVAEMWLAGYDMPKDRPAEQKKNDKLAMLIAKLRFDDELFSMVDTLAALPEDQRASIKTILTGLSK